MAWAWVYLAVSLMGALLVVNAFRPARHQLLSCPASSPGGTRPRCPSGTSSWQVAATVAFALEGASGPGRVGGPRRQRRLLDRTGGARPGVAGAGGVFSRAEAEMRCPARSGGSPRPWWRHHVALPPSALSAAPPGPVDDQVVRNVDYVGDGVRAHRLDIIRRRGHAPTGAPVLVYIHGGAWVIGDKREQGLPLLYELARRGWVTVTINYRLSPKATWPDHIVDCKRALSWVRDHIAEYGGAPGFIAVSGGSAGGHLAHCWRSRPVTPPSNRGSRRPTPPWTPACRSTGSTT